MLGATAPPSSLDPSLPFPRQNRDDVRQILATRRGRTSTATSPPASSAASRAYPDRPRPAPSRGAMFLRLEDDGPVLSAPAPATELCASGELGAATAACRAS